MKKNDWNTEEIDKISNGVKKFCFVVVLTVLSGCAFVSQNLFEAKGDKLALHMSKDEVVEHMGKPREIKTLTIYGEEYEAWRYPIERKFAKRYNALDTSYYEVLFFEGKVLRWEKVKKYAQPEYDFMPMTPEGNVKTYEFFRGKEGK